MKLKESPQEIYPKLGISRATFYKALSRLVEEGSINPTAYGLELNEPSDTESQIRDCPADTLRDRLKSQLGGLTEVKTPAGRIDLLTETEIIEVKRVGEWKSGLGLILVYSVFYPEHRKQLHLFGSAKDEGKIADIANFCLAFDVFVSFEIVVGVKS